MAGSLAYLDVHDRRINDSEPAAKLKFHGSSLLVASPRGCRSRRRGCHDSRGCNEETAAVEFRLYDGQRLKPVDRQCRSTLRAQKSRIARFPERRIFITISLFGAIVFPNVNDVFLPFRENADVFNVFLNV